jgi:hypothetical protein
MTDPRERLVLSYMSEPHYHRPHPDDESRPACAPDRIRGVVAIRTQAERRGQTACPICWPENDRA